MQKKDRLIIGVTEPSHFTKDCIYTIEQFFDANPVKLCQNEPEDLSHWLGQCDAVILAGGVDIHPRTYAHSVMNDYNFSRFDISRDRREIRIIDWCIKNDLPILGICRGHQMLGVYHGLTFVPDLSESHTCHQPSAQKVSHEKDEPMHWVRLTTKGYPSFKALPSKEEVFCSKQARDPHYLWVNSFHHQALLAEQAEKRVKILGVAIGHGGEQKIVELMSSSDKSRWLSCQWHPEYDWDNNVASQMILSTFLRMVKSEPRKRHKVSVRCP